MAGVHRYPFLALVWLAKFGVFELYYNDICGTGKAPGYCWAASRTMRPQLKQPAA